MDASLLGQINLFQGVDTAGLAAAAAAGVDLRCEAGEYLYQQGDPAERLFVLVAGKVKLSQLTEDGQQVILRYAGPGEPFGLLSVEEADYPVSAQAVVDSQVLAWPRAGMVRLIEQHPRIARNMIHILAARIQEFQDRLRELATERVERRIARALIRLARQVGRQTPDGILIDLPLSREDLAQMTGTTLYTVSRTLSGWESHGLVRSKREQVLILFPHGLVQIAEDLPGG